MILTSRSKQILEYCFGIYQDQYDRFGIPYFIHAYDTARDMENDSDFALAMLHNVLAAPGLTRSQLIEAGLNLKEIEVLSLLHHRRRDSFEEYIQRLAHNKQAARIKRSDLYQQLLRMQAYTPQDAKRIAQARKAIAYLDGILK